MIEQISTYYFITAIIIFVSDGLEYRENIHNEMPFKTIESCEKYLETYESAIRLSITKAAQYYKVELKDIKFHNWSKERKNIGILRNYFNYKN